MSRSIYARLARRYGRGRAITRREMLKRSAGALAAGGLGVGLAGGLLSCAGGDGARRRRREHGGRVVVVGAGLGGLACAYELGLAGYRVDVVEARGRVGGRVVTLRDLVPGRHVEGGGELIGANHPAWLRYAGEFGIELMDVSEHEDLAQPVVLEGRELPDAEAEGLYLEMERAIAVMTSDAGLVDDAESPWESEGAGVLDRRPTSDWLAGVSVSGLCRRALRALLEADCGVALERQSYLGNLAAVKGGGLEAYWLESEAYRCARGNQRLAERLAAEVGEERVHLGDAAERVEHGERAWVRTASGAEFEGDWVVLAVPPSVWGRMVLEPGLPEGLRPQMGVVVKHLSSVRGRYWLAAGRAPAGLTDGDVAMTWEGTDGQAGGDGAPAGLVGFAGGPGAERLRAAGPDGRERAVWETHERVVPGYRGHVLRTRFMDWPGDRWAGAGYSFPGPGEVTTVGPRLREGVGRLGFAGEHCSPAFPGYMEGALSSGVRLAVRIAARDGVAVIG